MTKYDIYSSATDPIVMRVFPELAQEIGLNASLVLLQLAFWIKIANHEHDGNSWTYQSLRDMQRKAFPFWSHMTIQRAIERLIDLKLIVTRDDLNKRKEDNTRWFALNPDGLKALETIALVELTGRKHVGLEQIDTGVYQNVTPLYQNVTTLPENTPETTQERESAPPPATEELPDHLSPAQRRIIERPNGDGGALAYTLIEAYCDAWDVTIQKYRDQWHRAHLRGANDLAALGATPEEIKAMVAERREKGKQPDQCPMTWMATDYVGWKSRTARAEPAEAAFIDVTTEVDEDGVLLTYGIRADGSRELVGRG